MKETSNKKSATTIVFWSILSAVAVLAIAVFVLLAVPYISTKGAINKYYKSVGEHPYYNNASDVNLETITEAEFNLKFFEDENFDVRNYLTELVSASNEEALASAEVEGADEKAVTQINFDMKKLVSFFDYIKAQYEADKELMILQNGNYYVSYEWLNEAYNRYLNNAIQIIEQKNAEEAILDLYEKVVEEAPFSISSIDAPLENSAFNTMKTVNNICADEELAAELLELNNKMDRIIKVAYESAYESVTGTGEAAESIGEQQRLNFDDYSDEMKYQMFLGGCDTIQYAFNKTYLNVIDDALATTEEELLKKVSDKTDTLMSVYKMFGVSSEKVTELITKFANNASRKYSNSVSEAEGKIIADKITNNFWIWLSVNGVGGVKDEEATFSVTEYNNVSTYNIDIVNMSGADKPYARECWSYAHQTILDMIATAAGINYDTYGIFSELTTEMRDKYYALYDMSLYRACEDASYVFGYLGEYLGNESQE